MTWHCAPLSIDTLGCHLQSFAGTPTAQITATVLLVGAVLAWLYDR
jgi:hypothetical protein